MSRKLSPPRRSKRRLDRDELAGYAEGLAHQLADQRTKGTPDESGERELLRWRHALAVGDLRQAAEGLTRLDERLRAGRSELALREFPRGLTDYVPRGSRGMPGGREDDSLGNRLLIAGRLLTVRRSQGVELTGTEMRLREAEGAYAAGDMNRARDLCHRVLSELESARAPGSGDPS
ncbi:MAG: hypothetical protein WCA77_00935 [Thermoplasmata archaeon]